MQKSEKKKIKFFYGTFPLAIFLFPIIKRAEKVSAFFISVKGEGECEKNYKKKEKKFFPPLGRFFDHFWSLVSRKR